MSATSTPAKPTLATTWLDGCSGCHMSFVDLDERLLEIAELVDLVYSPLVDTKDYPDWVDICLVEGAVSSEDDLHKILMLREHTGTLVSFGDCAVTANVPGHAQPDRAGPAAGPGLPRERRRSDPGVPLDVVPALLPMARPVNRVVPVDVYLPGCPPSADLIHRVLLDLVEGRTPDTTGARFGR